MPFILCKLTRHGQRRKVPNQLLRDTFVEADSVAWVMAYHGFGDYTVRKPDGTYGPVHRARKVT